MTANTLHIAQVENFNFQKFEKLILNQLQKVNLASVLHSVLHHEELAHFFVPLEVHSQFWGLLVLQGSTKGYCTKRCRLGYQKPCWLGSWTRVLKKERKLLNLSCAQTQPCRPALHKRYQFSRTFSFRVATSYPECHSINRPKTVRLAESRISLDIILKCRL